jgi:hypothetical protein
VALFSLSGLPGASFLLLVVALKYRKALGMACPGAGAKAVQVAREVEAAKAKAALEDRWAKWLAAAPDLGIPDASALNGEELDGWLRDFVFDQQKSSIRLERLTSQRRRWVHRRAEQLGLDTETGNARLKEMGYTLPLELSERLTVTKPHGWRMHWNKAFAYRTVPIPPTFCDHCGTKLFPSQALYHYSGLGPLCQQCAASNHRLAELKWETPA